MAANEVELSGEAGPSDLRMPNLKNNFVFRIKLNAKSNEICKKENLRLLNDAKNPDYKIIIRPKSKGSVSVVKAFRDLPFTEKIPRRSLVTVFLTIEYVVSEWRATLDKVRVDKSPLPARHDPAKIPTLDEYSE